MRNVGTSGPEESLTGSKVGIALYGKNGVTPVCREHLLHEVASRPNQAVRVRIPANKIRLEYTC